LSKIDKNLRNKLTKVFAVGVGPGSPSYISDVVKDVIKNSDVIIGYKYTLKTIEELISGKEVHEVTMQNQEDVYQKISKNLGEKKLVIPFTGDVNFSESEVVDRLIEIFGDVEIIPGISSIQVAASKAKVPLWRRAWQLPPVFLPGESPWTEEPGGLQPWGCTELDMTERLSTAQHRATSVLVEMPIIRVLLATAGSAAKHVMGCQQCFLIHWRLVISTTWNTSRRQLK